jgi:trimeric autotransporter adhesin
MKNRLLTAALAGILMGSAISASAQSATLYGITNANAIFTMSSASSPSSISGPYSISGITSGQFLVGIASRSSNGMLYALGYDSSAGRAQLYTITSSGASYVATAVGASLYMSLGTTNNAAFAFVSDFDNQIRVIGRNGNNYVMNADSGTVMATGSTLGYVSGDTYFGTSATVAATSYTNHFYGSDATEEVGYDIANNVLFTFDAGTYANGFNNASSNMHSVGITSALSLATGSNIGMDTWYDSATHSNTTFLAATNLFGSAHLYSYNWGIATTGTLNDLGAIGTGSITVRGIAFGMSAPDSTAPVTGHLATALTLNLRNLVFFDSYSPSKIRREVRLSGMTSGQTMLAIDYGADFNLYGFGYNYTSGTYQLYRIDTTTGSVTAINSTAASLNLGTDDGSGDHINVGFRFIANSANRIRVIGNGGRTNVQISATTGLVVETDSALTRVSGDASSGDSLSLTSFAYTDTYSGDTSSQLLGYDAVSGSLVLFDAANDTMGYGTGSSGYISTDFSLSAVLSLFSSGSGTTYNNAYLDIMYTGSTNVGYMASNYYGDSSYLENYASFYDMTSINSAYARTSGSSMPSYAGTIGKGIPVKDMSLRKTYNSLGVSTARNNNQADLLLYPNPAVTNARIVLPEASYHDVFLEVIDLNGNVISSYQYPAGTYQLDFDVNTLPVGLYSLRVIQLGVSYHNLKLVKN